MIQITSDARIIITALPDPDTGLEAVRSGARGYVTKPFTAEQLREEIAYVLESTSERK